MIGLKIDTNLSVFKQLLRQLPLKSKPDATAKLPKKAPKPRADGQMSGLAAEFFVAAELLKRDIQTSVTFGNAKAIDLLAHNAKTKKNFTVQVKALRKPNYFLIKPATINANHTYIFVLLNTPDKAVEYFIVPGGELLNDPSRFDKYFRDTSTMSGIYWKSPVLGTFKNKWEIFSA